MNKVLQTIRRQEGFTLVELMVVVAIIGLLSAVAIPNFQKYQARSKTAEAKLQLSAIYTAEASFFADYNIYHNCLNYMGFNPTEEQSARYYAIGFGTTAGIDATAYQSASNAGINTTACPQAGTAASGTTWFPAGKGIGSSIANAVAYVTGSNNGDQSVVANMTYTAVAGGIIHKSYTGSGSASRFSINHEKRINTLSNGY